MSYSFAADAETEYLDAIQFYENMRPGLGAALIDAFEQIVGLAEKSPESWKLVHSSGIRSIGLTRFPYVAFYRVLTPDQIQIMAFAHERRSPGYWLGRIGT